MNHGTRFLPTFAVLEPNRLVGLRNGDMIAQSILRAADKQTISGINVLENGALLEISAANEIRVAQGGNLEADITMPLFVHFTEELLVEGLHLHHFAAEEDANGDIYPRAIRLYPGDQFTTDNAATITAIGSAVAARFFEEDTTLPDGVTSAKKFTFKG